MLYLLLLISHLWLHSDNYLDFVLSVKCRIVIFQLIVMTRCR